MSDTSKVNVIHLNMNFRNLLVYDKFTVFYCECSVGVTTWNKGTTGLNAIAKTSNLL